MLSIYQSHLCNDNSRSADIYDSKLTLTDLDHNHHPQTQQFPEICALTVLLVTTCFTSILLLSKCSAANVAVRSGTSVAGVSIVIRFNVIKINSLLSPSCVRFQQHLPRLPPAAPTSTNDQVPSFLSTRRSKHRVSSRCSLLSVYCYSAPQSH